MSEIRQIIQKGERAEQVLKNPVFEDALLGMKMRIFDELRMTKLEDVEQREHLHQLMRSADIFEGELKKYLNAMTAEKAKLNKKQAKRII
jgi:hypothetical protein